MLNESPIDYEQSLFILKQNNKERGGNGRAKSGVRRAGKHISSPDFARPFFPSNLFGFSLDRLKERETARILNCQSGDEYAISIFRTAFNVGYTSRSDTSSVGPRWGLLKDNERGTIRNDFIDGTTLSRTTLVCPNSQFVLLAQNILSNAL